jgi:2-keto-4-pentenoate hydratase/2-oxohepta-3-ene-1,7-dioic acid hydratase in catechol pathway
MILACFLGTGGFLIRYANGHTKENIQSIKEALRLLLTKHYPFNQNVNTFQSSQHRNVRTDILGTGRGSLAIRGAHFGNSYFYTVSRKASKSCDGQNISKHIQEFRSANPNQKVFFSQRTFLKPWLSCYLHTDHVTSQHNMLMLHKFSWTCSGLSVRCLYYWHVRRVPVTLQVDVRR